MLASPETSPFISVIVPVRNEEASLGKTLAQLLQQNYPASCFGIIVVDGESEDGTRWIVRAFQARHANLRLCYNRKRLSSAARNIGIHEAQGKIVVIVDGHCDLQSDDYLHELAEAFSRSGADCIGRPQPLDVRGAGLLQRAIAAARSSWLGHHPESWIYSSKERFVRPQSVAVAYRRSVFDSVGFFDESFDACEDVDFNHRIEQAGLSCFFTPKVAVHYSPRSSLLGLFRQLFRYGRGRGRLLRKYPDTFSLACFLPMFFLLGLIVGPVLAILAQPLETVYFGAMIVYGLLVGSFSLATAWRRKNLALLPCLPVVFATIHLGSGAGLLYELIGGWALVRHRLPSELGAQTAPQWGLGPSPYPRAEAVAVLDKASSGRR
jgi:succinoglycan biosynthesis protein ExoA